MSIFSSIMHTRVCKIGCKVVPVLNEDGSVRFNDVRILPECQKYMDAQRVAEQEAHEKACPVAGKEGICSECHEWTSLCSPCCGHAIEPGGSTSSECLYEQESA